MLADAVARNARGESICHIAKSYGRERSALYRLLKRQGIAIRNDGSWARTLTLPTDPLDIGYMAGLVDGEGSVMRPPRLEAWQVKVGMTDRCVIEWLASFGGVFNVEPRPEGRKTAYSWTVTRRLDVAALLRLLAPHLRVPAKRERAEQAIAEYAEY